MVHRVAPCLQTVAHRESIVCALPRAISVRDLTSRDGEVVVVRAVRGAGVRVLERCSRVGRAPERRRAGAGEASLSAARPRCPAHHLRWWQRAQKAVAVRR
jgi:hypothetical protein